MYKDTHLACWMAVYTEYRTLSLQSRCDPAESQWNLSMPFTPRLASYPLFVTNHEEWLPRSNLVFLGFAIETMIRFQLDLCIKKETLHNAWIIHAILLHKTTCLNYKKRVEYIWDFQSGCPVSDPFGLVTCVCFIDNETNFWKEEWSTSVHEERRTLSIEM